MDNDNHVGPEAPPADGEYRGEDGLTAEEYHAQWLAGQSQESEPDTDYERPYGSEDGRYADDGDDDPYAGLDDSRDRDTLHEYVDTLYNQRDAERQFEQRIRDDGREVERAMWQQAANAGVDTEQAFADFTDDGGGTLHDLAAFLDRQMTIAAMGDDGVSEAYANDDPRVSRRDAQRVLNRLSRRPQRQPDAAWLAKVDAALAEDDGTWKPKENTAIRGRFV